jgi:hypothetical protein
MISKESIFFAFKRCAWRATALTENFLFLKLFGDVASQISGYSCQEYLFHAFSRLSYDN